MIDPVEIRDERDLKMSCRKLHGGYGMKQLKKPVVFFLEKTGEGIKMTSKEQPLITFVRGAGNLRSGCDEMTFYLKNNEERTIYGEGKDSDLKIVFHSEDDLTAAEIEASVRLNTPRFGFQNEFSDIHAVEVFLIPEEQVPFVSIYQHKEWWMRPAFGNTWADVPDNSQCIICKREKVFEIFLAVSGRDCRADFKGTENGLSLFLSSNQTGRLRISDIAMIYGRGADPYALLERMVGYALTLTGKELKLRKDKPFPAVFEEWGWCTWDSLGQDVDETAILAKMEDFKRLGLSVPWVLIDDGWSGADRTEQTLSSFDEDSDRFPDGLENTVQVLKEKYGVKNVGVWQAVKGYWNGIQPGSEAECAAAGFLKKYPSGVISIDSEPHKSFGFWDKWHTCLQKKGITFVKVDSQSSFSLMTKGACTYGDSAGSLHKGLDASADLHFKGNLINCMGMAPEDIWNRYSSSLSRSSDDFTPTVPGSFEEHALQNSFNSVYHGCFYWGDWDMAWTVHEDSTRSLLLRAISGGPFYISDGLRKTDPDKITAMISEEGRILRCEDVGRPTLDCLTDPAVLKAHPLKIFNRFGDTIYVAVFRGMEAASSKGVLKIEEIPGIDTEKNYWVYSPAAGQAVRYDRNNGYSFAIEEEKAMLLQIIPVEKMSIIGILDKHISSAAVEIVARFEKSILVRVLSAGVLGVLFTGKEIQVIRRGNIYKTLGNEQPVRERTGEFLRIKDMNKGDLIELSSVE